MKNVDKTPDKTRVFKKIKKTEKFEASAEVYYEIDYSYVPVPPLQLYEVKEDSTVYFKVRGTLILYLVTGFLLVLIAIVWASYTLTATGSLYKSNNRKCSLLFSLIDPSPFSLPTDNSRYYITQKNTDGSFFVIENIDSTNWIEWYVKREPFLRNRLHPSGIYSWELANDTGDGIVILYDATRKSYSRLSSEGWFFKLQNLDFRLYMKGDWSTVRPKEIENGTRTFEICQKYVNNCAYSGNQPGCCGPKVNRSSDKCCNFNINTCVSCLLKPD